jgi:hypothetical protein
MKHVGTTRMEAADAQTGPGRAGRRRSTVPAGAAGAGPPGGGRGGSCGRAFESKPWPTLTLIVSLEAIFLSTFVMIGQNRQAAFQQAKADHDFTEQELELKTNTQLTREIHQLTAELYHCLMDGRAR